MAWSADTDAQTFVDTTAARLGAEAPIELIDDMAPKVQCPVHVVSAVVRPRAHIGQTDDFYGPLQISFTPRPSEDPVIIDVGDGVELVVREPTSYHVEPSGTGPL